MAHSEVQAAGEGGLLGTGPPGKGRWIYSVPPRWEASCPSSPVPVELKAVQLVRAGKCKSRADKGISFHGLRLARSTAAACSLLEPMRGGGGERKP